MTENLLVTNKAKLIDNNSNIYEIDQLYYDFEKSILGKDILVNDDNKLSSKKYLPRIGRSLIFENGNSVIKNNTTNCERKRGCPPWSIQADEIFHDKKDKP